MPRGSVCGGSATFHTFAAMVSVSPALGVATAAAGICMRWRSTRAGRPSRSAVMSRSSRSTRTAVPVPMPVRGREEQENRLRRVDAEVAVDHGVERVREQAQSLPSGADQAIATPLGSRRTSTVALGLLTALTAMPTSFCDEAVLLTTLLVLSQ